MASCIAMQFVAAENILIISIQGECGLKVSALVSCNALQSTGKRRCCMPSALGIM